MKYIRYLVYGLVQLGIISGGVWLYSTFSHIPLLQLHLLSPKFLGFVVFSFAPLISMVAHRKKLQIDKIPGITSKPLVLRSEFKSTLKGTVKDLKARIRDICNSIMLTDRVLVLVQEAEDRLVFETEARIDEIGPKVRKRRSEPMGIEVTLHVTERPGEVEVELSSFTETREFGLDNVANEENLAAIVKELEHAGLITMEGKR